jgi:CAAX protease family protein
MVKQHLARRNEEGNRDPLMTMRWKTILSPLGRIALAVLMVGGSVAAAQVVVKALEGALSLGGVAPAIYYIAYLIASVLVAYFVYRAYVHFVEKRAITELSGPGAPSELGVGMLVGFVMVSAIIVILWLLGDYQITGLGVWTVVLVLLANNGAGAFVEEVMLRGVVFRISEEKLGTWIALALSVVLFALLHLASGNATATSFIVIGFEGGVLLSAAYVLTRRLWLAIGIHFGWDFAQTYVFGVTKGVKGMVGGRLDGSALLSGGNAGIEGSILALVFCLIVVTYLLARAARKGNIVKPSRRLGGVKARVASKGWKLNA